MTTVLRTPILQLLFLASYFVSCHSFTLVMMGSRRRKGSLKRSLDPSTIGDGARSQDSIRSLNAGKGQEITGVTLPSEGTIKGWEFGNKVQMACANVGGNFYALQGNCPRCAFDLYKGDLVVDDAGFTDLPRVACPTCGTTFSLRTGKHGPAIKRSGLAGFVNGLAKSATLSDSSTDAKAFLITRDADGRVYCKER